MKILVTGAGGFLGTHICHYFKKHQWAVIAVGRFHSPFIFRQIMPGDVNIIEMNFPSPQFPKLLATERPDLVVHCASSASVPISIQDPYADLRQSVDIYASVLEAIRIHSPETFVVFLSSASVYGQPQVELISEKTTINPISPYGYHKWLCEILSQEYSSLFGLSVANLRIFSAYGEYLYKQVIYDILTKMTSSINQDIILHGTGQETRDFIHASDVATAISLIYANKSADTYNLATGTSTSIAELATSLKKIYGFEHNILFNGIPRSGDPHCWQSDISKIKSIGFRPSICLNDGLIRVTEWYRRIHLI